MWVKEAIGGTAPLVAALRCGQTSPRKTSCPQWAALRTSRANMFRADDSPKSDRPATTDSSNKRHRGRQAGKPDSDSATPGVTSRRKARTFVDPKVDYLL